MKSCPQAKKEAFQLRDMASTSIIMLYFNEVTIPFLKTQNSGSLRDPKLYRRDKLYKCATLMIGQRHVSAVRTAKRVSIDLPPSLAL